MICPKCNKETRKGKKCTNCGESIEEFIKQKRADRIYKIKIKIMIFLILIFIILLALVIVPNVYHKKNSHSYEKIQNENEALNVNKSDRIINEDDYILETSEYKFELTEENKTEDLDKDGLTNEEEVSAGTFPNFEDSDGDGLNDYEELKNYNTDPLKYSTSGDNISDYVKVKKDLDVKKKYSNNEIAIENIEVNSKITLIPDNLESEVLGEFDTFSYDENVNSIDNKFTVYQFEGEIKYKLDKVDVVLLVYYNSEYTEFDDYSIKADVMTINIDKDDNSKVFIITTTENYKNYLNEGGER